MKNKQKKHQQCNRDYKYINSKRKGYKNHANVHASQHKIVGII